MGGALAALLLSVIAHAECPSVDYSDHFGAVRDQGNAEWCGAFTGADLLGEYLGIKPPDKISAFDMAAAMANPSTVGARRALSSLKADRLERNSNSFMTIFLQAYADPEWLRAHMEKSHPGQWLFDRRRDHPAEIMAAYAFKGGYCLESSLPSQAIVGSSVSRSILGLQLKNSGAQDFLERQVAEMETKTGVSLLRPEPVCRKFTFGAVPEALDPAFARAIADFAVSEVAKEVDERCGRRTYFDPPEIAFSQFSSAKLLSVLGAGHSAEITYRSSFLMNSPQNDRDGHSSLVVGSRPGPNGACQFKIRNSWGRTCAYYDKSKVFDCKDGTFWVDAATLTEQAEGLTSLEKP